MPWFALSPDGKTLAGSCEVRDGAVARSSLRFWNAFTGRMTRDLPGSFDHGAYSPDGKWFAASGLEDVSIIDVVTGRAFQQLPPCHEHIWAVAFSRTERRSPPRRVSSSAFGTPAPGRKSIPQTAMPGRCRQSHLARRSDDRNGRTGWNAHPLVLAGRHRSPPHRRNRVPLGHIAVEFLTRRPDRRRRGVDELRRHLLPLRCGHGRRPSRDSERTIKAAGPSCSCPADARR